MNSMKKTYKYAVVGLLFLFLAGCEDFLDKRNHAPEKNLAKTVLLYVADISSAITPTYVR